MEIRRYDERLPKITEIKVRQEEGQVILSFKWPNALEQICVYKENMLSAEKIDLEKPYRKYTRSEYARFNGFVDPVAGSAMCRYMLCPLVSEGETTYLVYDEAECCSIEVITQKIEVRYQIVEKKKLFSNRKTIQMHVFCETPLPKDYLYYVKKRGSIPVGVEDGMCFQFISDFAAGDNVLSEIEVDKEDQVRIYLSDEVPFKEVYRVIKV